jgi:glutaredoxin-like protein NrdH
MKVTVYEKPDCIQCKQTKKYFEQHGITFETKQLEGATEIEQLIADKGYAAAPIVVAGDSSWSGFRLERMKNLIAIVKAPKPIEKPDCDCRRCFNDPKDSCNQCSEAHMDCQSKFDPEWRGIQAGRQERETEILELLKAEQLRTKSDSRVYDAYGVLTKLIDKITNKEQETK